MTVHRLRTRSGRQRAGSPSAANAREVPFAAATVTRDARRAVHGVLASGWLTTGRETARFEDEFAAWVRAPHAVAVSSCTAALELALRSLRLAPGSLVLIPAVTFCGAAEAILHAGLRPALVDVDPRTATATPEAVDRAVRACGRPAAMVVLHYAGAPAPVAELAEAAGLPLDRIVEDAAHALGTRAGGHPVGSASPAACFSFYATKNLPIGEGGMITTGDEERAAWFRRARLHGMSADAWRRNLPGGSWRYTVDEAGLKANMTDVQAAIGRAHLRRLGAWQRRRDAIAARYADALAGVPGIEPLDVPEGGGHAWHLYAVRVLAGFGTGRDDLVERLADRGIGTSVHFTPLHHMPFFREAAVSPRGLPGADALFPLLLSLPMYPGLPDSSVDRVADELARLARAPVPPAARRAPAPRPPAAERRHPDGPAPGGRRGLRTLVVGAGEAGRALARDLAGASEFGLRPIGFLDDRPADAGPADLPVLGGLDDTREAALAHGAEAVVVAIPGLSPERFRHVVRQAGAAGVSVRYLPSFIAALRRDVVGSDMRALDVHTLIGRSEMHVVSPETRSIVAGKRVLVTGAGGSIGSELCRQVRGFEPARLFLLDHDESNLHRLQLELDGDALVDDDILICDIRDGGRVRQIFDEQRPDVVFHAAAHKHLPLLERHPCEGVKSNVLGTENLVQAALASGVERFVLISTDKAADPISILGATKRLAELTVQANAGGECVLAAVRFGNVLGSRGSLLSVLAEQLSSGEPVTVTHPDVARFFMTVEEAVGLVLEAARLARGGEVFVLDMGDEVRIVDLVHKFARSVNVPDPEIRFTGLRTGEKLSESLFSEQESYAPTAHPKILATASAAAPDLGDLRRSLPGLYAAAERNDAAGTRRSLAAMIPGFPASAPPGPRALTVPYPDDF
ncbi:polysaccharide biosynthesis protein [Streptomyces genisteinicus]|uniref:Polysaccharide biosynthesis protein n=1 Tax=Streptomyces genisteinicus TaxID=2768068 RepID=A0A7H0HQV8_9ACTN|nr:polysaccharide biosynthesis protein [Streptomyces genisteinicus]QNP62924.1 polysaccharide biosynthesis protein [Streptomyces genisteinicus]